MKNALHKLSILALVIVPLLTVATAIVLLWQRYVFATDLILLGVFYSISVIGITVGYHRMLTHEGFKTYSWVRALFIIAGAMAVDGQPIGWSATHIRHHAHSDDEHDPHSPLHGFWHAHFGWLFNTSNFEDDTTYAPHFADDALVQWIDKTTYFWVLLGLAIPFAIGGWTGLLWGGGVRIFLLTHVTWSVNSICHTFGKRDYETTDESKNNWVVGLLAFGEGWHNNHHAFPRNAFHGMEWWQVDVSKYIIWTLEKLGLVWDVQRVAVDAKESQKTLAVQMMEAASDLRDQLAQAIVQARADLNASPANDKIKAAQKRLNEINATLTRAAHMKRQSLKKYLEEVHALTRKVQSFAS
ncbi:MAG: fatty acid desaturase [bacterium]|nr:fatty acid desaturase [bacterium]